MRFFVRLLAVCLALGVGFESFADGVPGITRGNFLRKPEYQTYATVGLFVDPTGNDSNSCTSTGTAACLTVNGAIGKLPRFIRNSVTITLATGTYTENVTLQDLYFQNNITLTITGPSLTAFTPATGASTGTLTAFTDAAAGAIGVMTDSGQSWTVNDLRGRFVRITSGGASGQRRAIVSNTATSLEFAGYFSSDPAAGATYAIETPAAIISGAFNVRPNIVFSPSSANIVSLTNLDLTSSAGSAVTVDRTFQGTVRFPDSRILSSHASSAALQSSSMVGGGLSSPAVIMGTGAANPAWTIFGDSSVVPQNFGTAAQPPGPFLYSAGASAILSSAAKLIFTINGAQSGVYETGSATADVFAINPGSIIFASSTNTSTAAAGFFRCPAGSTGTALKIGSSRADLMQFQLNYFTFMNCAVGVAATGYIGIPTVGTLTFVSTTTAISLNNGAWMSLPSSPTFTGVTNEIAVDGTNYTYAFVNGLSPKFLTNAATKSSIGIY